MFFELIPFPRKTVTTAGQRIQIYNADISIFGIVLQAMGSNTGSIYLGDNRVSSIFYLQEMLAFDTFSLEIGKFFRNAEILISDLWIDSSVNGEGITGAMLTAKDRNQIFHYQDVQQAQLEALHEIINHLKGVKV